MRKIILIGMVLMFLPIVSAISIEESPSITLILEISSTSNNIEHQFDNNIKNVYCDSYEGNICHVYRTNSRHTTLTGE